MTRPMTEDNVERLKEIRGIHCIDGEYLATYPVDLILALIAERDRFREALKRISSPQSAQAVETQIKQMVDRFLCWTLPKDFQPDCGIHFEPWSVMENWLQNDGNRRKPVGTNLFTATQAKAMLRHMIAAAPPQPGEIVKRPLGNGAYRTRAEVAALIQRLSSPQWGD